MHICNDSSYVLAVCAQLCLTLCHSTDYSPPDSSVHGIFQARILEWVAISYSRGSSQPRGRICISCTSCIGRWIHYPCTTWEALPGSQAALMENSGLTEAIWSLPRPLDGADWPLVSKKNQPFSKKNTFIPYFPDFTALHGALDISLYKSLQNKCNSESGGREPTHCTSRKCCSQCISGPGHPSYCRINPSYCVSFQECTMFPFFFLSTQDQKARWILPS